MEVVGIDVSKKTIDVYKPSKGHIKVNNTVEGFSKLAEWGGISHYVMESTGSYHYQLATYLYGQGLSVSVVNPLPVKRFIQMRLQRVKTDKSDAKMLSEYGLSERPKLWVPDPEHISYSKQTLSVLELYTKQQTALKNKIDSLLSGGVKKGKPLSSLRLQLKRIEGEIKKLEEELQETLSKGSGKAMTQLRSIPGIGKKTAAMLLVYSNEFRDFDNYRQFIAYAGLCPVHRQSGSSVRGRSYISKKGNKLLRNHLFLCSFTASQHNAQCRALYERIVAKGKSKKLALIAVANKLIKQSFGVIKNDLIYDPNYVSMKQM